MPRLIKKQERHKNYLQTITVIPITLTGRELAEKQNKKLWKCLFWEVELILGPCQLALLAPYHKVQLLKMRKPAWTDQALLLPQRTFGSSCLSNSVCKTCLSIFFFFLTVERDSSVAVSVCYPLSQ